MSEMRRRFSHVMVQQDVAVPGERTPEKVPMMRG